MADDIPAKNYLLDTLILAIEVRARIRALDLLVDTAQELIRENEKAEAARLLAFVIAHPRSKAATRARAEKHFLQLEAEICPRAIVEAKEYAASSTLEDVVVDLLEATISDI
ncbi:MAG: hypothetical protein D6737_14355 [Chloroflexi bacterium]|nr:MAG: hypothetical protein D6737_14355 [Chloroflexota bacterium]